MAKCVGCGALFEWKEATETEHPRYVCDSCYARMEEDDRELMETISEAFCLRSTGGKR